MSGLAKDRLDSGAVVRLAAHSRWAEWDGSDYVYYFGNGGFVQYLRTPPPSPGKPLPLPRNQGRYTVDGDKLVVTWNPLDGTPTVETFGALANATRMNGLSNRYSPLVATKL